MKKRGLEIFFVGIMIFLIFPISANSLGASCNLNVSLINQDPYPVIPGDYVELVFQISGVENVDCRGATFELIENYPFSLDKNESGLKEISGSTFVRDYKKVWMVPYKVRIDGDAVEGMNEIEVKYSSGAENVFFSEKFNVKIEDVRVDFEVSVKEYDATTNEITFEILNTGENDVEALTVNLLEQENLEIMSSPRNIVGSLDSNEETTFIFNGMPKEGEIKMEIKYTDEINERRTISKRVEFNPQYFNKNGNDKKVPVWLYVSIVLFLYIIYKYYRESKKRKKS